MIALDPEQRAWGQEAVRETQNFANSDSMLWSLRVYEHNILMPMAKNRLLGPAPSHKVEPPG